MNVDSDVPDSGAAFTFGKSRFESNVPGKFWIRDDPILQISCGDEHTALLTASGRVFTFGSNEWGQLGHGHTNSLCRPSCVKGLKHERVTIIACGRSHTLVATDSGHVYGFGANGEGQLGSSHEYTIHTAPVRIQGLEGVIIKVISGGADHSMALTDKGVVYVWGSGAEGQLGIDKVQCLIPTELKFDVSVMCLSAGYYHSAFVTVEGKLYTCGENESGKLGLRDLIDKKCVTPRPVCNIDGRIMYVSCGGSHTVALTVGGKAYSFGSGFNGQLGLSDRILEATTPHLISAFVNVKIARVSCGENHTGFLTDTGMLYTCGDTRHGKLALLEGQNEICSYKFAPTVVKRFEEFQVQQVACGGCHMLVLATMLKKTRSHSSEDSSRHSLAREKRRLQNAKLPPLRASTSLSNSSVTTPTSPLRSTTLSQLPSISKSPMWYVPLERVGDSSDNLDEADEVLSNLEYMNPFLDDLEEDQSIRHFDSDVESDGPETSDLNETHTIVRIDNTISVLRPIITDDSDSIQNVPCHGTAADEVHSFIKKNTSGVFEAHKADGRKTAKKNKNECKSQFYDQDAKSSSSSSTTSKSTKTCIVL